MTAEPVLALHNVSKFFGRGENRVHAVRSLSFALQPGRALALVGESGCGKTTVARLIMREHRPDIGCLSFRGQPVRGENATAMKQYRAAVQMIFQDPFSSLNPAHTIRHHLERPLRLHGGRLSSAEYDERARALLAQVALDPAFVMGKFPHELSGGQRQRISVARALAVDPQVIIADEPTSMLDVSVRLGLLDLLNDMKRKGNLALLYISHDIATARYVCEDIVVMYAGQAVEWGSTDQVLENPQHPYTRLLLDAVPAPDRRFEDGRFVDRFEIEAIRRNSAVWQTRMRRLGENHFMRPMPE
jgi:peptide/nickel transport system ATP-binding protein